MESFSQVGFICDDEELELPPGFRFHPTDEELITHYLSPKVLESKFTARAIGEVDLNKVEPWDLPWRAKLGEQEWYFFVVRDRKYPTGLRTNRATKAGYWKATGKDKEIYKLKTLVGMKKTLVFYKGRAPKGEKSNWVMHEYRLEGKSSLSNLPKTAKNEWVISRIFHKTSGGKKIHISGLMKTNNHVDELQTTNFPPLMDFSAQETHVETLISTSHMSSFSDHDHSEDIKPYENSLNNFFPPSKPSNISSNWDSIFSTQIPLNFESLPYLDSVEARDESILKFLLQNKNFKAEFPTEMSNISPVVSSRDAGHWCNNDRGNLNTSVGSFDLDYLWNY